MLKLNTDTLELRNISSHTSKKGTAYFVLACEDITDFKQYQFVCRDFSLIPQGLTRGEHIVLTLEYNRFKELSVVGVRKV